MTSYSLSSVEVEMINVKPKQSAPKHDDNCLMHNKLHSNNEINFYTCILINSELKTNKIGE